MKWIILIISVVFLAVIAALEIWKRLVPERSKLAKKIEISLVILVFVGGAAALIRQAVFPSVEEKIIEAVNTVFRKGAVPVEKLTDAHEEIGNLKDELTKAMRRVVKLESQGVKEAKGVIEELRKSGDMARLLEVLEKDRDVHRDQLIERNREIAAVAYLLGDIDTAAATIDEILKLKPDDMVGLNQKGRVHALRGELGQAEEAYRRVLGIGRAKQEEQWQSIAYGNLGLIHQTRGELDKAEEMFRDGLKIDEKLGRLEGMANSYSNLGVIYEERGDIERAREYWEKALGLYKRIGMPHRMEKVEEWIEGIGKGKK